MPPVVPGETLRQPRGQGTRQPVVPGEPRCEEAWTRLRAAPGRFLAESSPGLPALAPPTARLQLAWVAEGCLLASCFGRAISRVWLAAAPACSLRGLGALTSCVCVVASWGVCQPRRLDSLSPSRRLCFDEARSHQWSCVCSGAGCCSCCDACASRGRVLAPAPASRGQVLAPVLAVGWLDAVGWRVVVPSTPAPDRSHRLAHASASTHEDDTVGLAPHTFPA